MPEPLQAPCFKKPHSAACLTTYAKYTDAYYVGKCPGASMTPLWDCGLEAECCWTVTSTTCQQGQVPYVAVNATTAQIVQTAVQWATDHNIPLTVKATGHDYQGRSTSSDGLNIWVHYMKNVTYFDTWTTGCSGSESTKAMQTLGGDQWVDVYAEADE